MESLLLRVFVVGGHSLFPNRHLSLLSATHDVFTRSKVTEEQTTREVACNENTQLTKGTKVISSLSQHFSWNDPATNSHLKFLILLRNIFCLCDAWLYTAQGLDCDQRKPAVLQGIKEEMKQAERTKAVRCCATGWHWSGLPNDDAALHCLIHLRPSPRFICLFSFPVKPNNADMLLFFSYNAKSAKGQKFDNKFACKRRVDIDLKALWVEFLHLKCLKYP